jgi:hypothetical protein
MQASEGDATQLQGQPGAAPANAVVRVTDLDGTDTAYSTTALATGAFLIALPVHSGDELRFEWVLGNQRSAPSDVLFMKTADGFLLTPSPRFDCVTLVPGYVLDFGVAQTGAQTLGIENNCATELSIDSHAQRRNVPDFSCNTPTPVSVAPGTSSELQVTYTRISTALVEDTLFIQLTDAGTTIRYPVTLSAGQ